jgi:hypothetical protein
VTPRGHAKLSSSLDRIVVEESCLRYGRAMMRAQGWLVLSGHARGSGLRMRDGTPVPEQ